MFLHFFEIQIANHQWPDHKCISSDTFAESWESGGVSTDFSDEVKSTDFGWVAGVGVESGRFSADARYTMGLANIAKEGDNIKNKAFAVTVGVKLKEGWSGVAPQERRWQSKGRDSGNLGGNTLPASLFS